MSRVLETRRLLISTLAPIHMGTDEDYTPTSYVIEGEALYEFNTAAAAAVIPDSERAALMRALQGRPDQRMLKAVQAFFHKNRELLIPAAVNTVRVGPVIGAFYEARVGKAANIEASGRQVLNALEIQRCAYDASSRRPLMPGSGLKGAMRTALLDARNDGHALRPDERNRDLQQRLFRYARERGRMGDLHRDPMRLVQVADAPWMSRDPINRTEVRFAVNRKKQPVEKDGDLLQSQAERQGLYQLLECVPAFRLRAFEGRLSIPDVSQAGGRKGKLPELRFTFEDVASACNSFYLPRLTAELELLRKRGYLDGPWLERQRTLLDSLGPRMGRNEVFLLRVGRHSGAESVTLNGVRSIRVMKRKGESPEYLPEAKTVWLASHELDDQRHLLPFGWVLVEMLEPDRTPPGWAEAEETRRWACEADAAWLGQVRERREELGRRLKTELESRAKKRREQEEAERREKERKARWKAMSAEERAVEELACWLEEDREAGRLQAGGRLASRLVELLRAADESWNGPVCARLAELAEEIYRHIGWPAKKKQARQEQIERLRRKA